MTASSTYEIEKLSKMINDSLEEMETNSTKDSTETNTRSNFTIQGNQTAPHHGRLGNPLGSWCASADGFDDHNLVVDLGRENIYNLFHILHTQELSLIERQPNTNR